MKNIGRVVRLSVVLLALVSPALQAATISLEVSGDTALSAALSTYNDAHSTAYVDTDGGASLGANDIEVSGSGVLTFSRPLGSWTGNLTVSSGAKVRAVVNETTVLGNATQGAAFVASGAALIVDHSVNVGNGHAIVRTIHIAGDGQTAGENGALKLIGNNTSLRSAVPMKLQLDDDAVLCFGSAGASGNQDHQFIADNGQEWNLSGHRLTITTAGWPHATRPTFFYGMKVSGGGHLVHDGVSVIFRAATIEGGAENTFTIRNGATVEFQSSFYPPAWTLKLEETASFNWGLNDGNDHALGGDNLRIWKGPVETPKTINLVDRTSGKTDVIGFAERVTGAGGILVSAPEGQRANKQFDLRGAGSDFTGGLCVSNFTMRLGAATAVPGGATAGPMTLHETDLKLTYDVGVDDFSFPETTFDGSGALTTKDNCLARGKFKSLKKTGAGTLTLSGELTGGDVTVEAGTLKFDLDHSASSSGLLSGRSSEKYFSGNPFASSDPADWLGDPSRPLKEVSREVLYTDNVVTSPEIFYSSIATDADRSAWRTKYYHRITTYSGYLTNDGDAPRQIRVICTLNAYVRIILGDSEYVSPTSGDIVRNVPATPAAPAMDRTMTVPAGVSRLEIRVYERYGNPSDGLCYGNVRTGGLTNWDDAHGLMWTEKLDSTDMDDYHKFEATGSTFMLSSVRRSKVESIALDSLNGSGVVDLGGGTLSVKSLSDDVQIVNGKVNVTAAKTLAVGRNELRSVATDHQLIHGLEMGMSSSVVCYENPWDSTRSYPDEPYKGQPIKDVIPAVMLGGSFADTLNAFYAPVLYDAQGERRDWTYYQRYITWSGYIWNPSDEPVVWKVLDVCNAYAWVTIGDKTCNNSSIYDSRSGGPLPGPMISETFTLQPGPNRFVVKFFDRFGYRSMTHGNVCTNGLTGWTDGHGPMWSTNLSATDMSEFHPFEDPGDGSFFTSRYCGENDGVSYACLSGVAGSELDLGRGGVAEVEKFVGVTRVSAGALIVSGEWTMTRAEVESADAVLDGVSFGPEATFDVLSDAALVKATSKGHVIARNVSGTVCPSLGGNLAGAGWSIELEDGEVRIMKSTGLFLILK